MEIKLPKQWKDWCRSMGLVPHYGSWRNKWNRYYLKGRGHVWRINCHGKLQRGDRIEDFDRWALCDITETDLPLNKEAFRLAVRTLEKPYE